MCLITAAVAPAVLGQLTTIAPTDKNNRGKWTPRKDSTSQVNEIRHFKICIYSVVNVRKRCKRIPAAIKFVEAVEVRRSLDARESFHFHGDGRHLDGDPSYDGDVDWNSEISQPSATQSTSSHAGFVQHLLTAQYDNI